MAIPDCDQNVRFIDHPFTGHQKAFLVRLSTSQGSRCAWLHGANYGPVAGGWQVVTVWESQEVADKFMTEKVNPARQKAGLAAPQNKVFPVHRLAK